MSYKKIYTLEDIRETAQLSFPDQFLLIANTAVYTFEKISYTNGDRVGRQADMLSIGHYYKKEVGPTVWAHTQGSCIKYYFGKPSEVCVPVPEAHKTCIYYHEPFKFMGSTQGCTDSRRSMTVGRKYEQTAFETVVHFVFLLTRRIILVSNDAGTDLLANLQFASMNLEHKLNAKKDGKYASPEQASKDATDLHLEGVASMEPSTVTALHKKHPRLSSPAVMTPRKRTRIGSRSLPIESSSPHILGKLALHEQFRNYDNTLDAKFRDETQAQQEEVQALQARLDDKKVAYEIMKGRYEQEKARRKVAEAKNEAWEYKSSKLEVELQQSQNRQTPGMNGRNLRSQVIAIKYRLHRGIINAAAPRETSVKQGAYHRTKLEPDSAEEEKYPASLHVTVIDHKRLRSDIDREYMKRMIQAKEGRRTKLTKHEKDNIYLSVIDYFEATEQIQIRQ